jgi:hypothetical protein
MAAPQLGQKEGTQATTYTEPLLPLGVMKSFEETLSDLDLKVILTLWSFIVF